MKIASILILAACIATALALPTGAPADVCDNLTPQGPHGQDARPPGAPYNIDLTEFFTCMDPPMLQPVSSPPAQLPATTSTVSQALPTTAASQPPLAASISMSIGVQPTPTPGAPLPPTAAPALPNSTASQPSPSTSISMSIGVQPTPMPGTPLPPTAAPAQPMQINYYYIPGMTYRLIFRGNDNVTLFRGFLVQARLQADGFTRVGQFVVPDEGGDVRLSSCTPNTDGVTHTNRADKNYVTFYWTAPPRGTGPIRFHYTIVRLLQRWWANEMTPVIQELPTPPQPTNGVPTPPQPTNGVPTPPQPTNGAPSMSGIGLWAVLAVATSVVLKALL